MSFGGDRFPSPAHTNLGNHLQTLHLDDQQEEPKTIFTSPMVISSAARPQGLLTPNSIEKHQTSDNLQASKAHNANRLAQFKPANIISDDHSLIDNGSVPPKNYNDSDEKNYLGPFPPLSNLDHHH